MQMQSLTSAVGMIWFLFASRNHIVHLISGRPLFFKWNSFTSLQIIYGGSETQFLVLHSISLIFNVDFLYQIIYLVYVYYQIQITSSMIDKMRYEFETKILYYHAFIIIHNHWYKIIIGNSLQKLGELQKEYFVSRLSLNIMWAIFYPLMSYFQMIQLGENWITNWLLTS